MDLNVQPPALWAYEVAEYCIAQRTNLLVLLNAWLDTKCDPTSETDWSTIRYWTMRLAPLWMKVEEEDSESDSDSDADAEAGSASASASNRTPDGEHDGRKPGGEVVVVVCNRCGEENGGWISVHGARVSLGGSF